MLNLSVMESPGPTDLGRSAAFALANLAPLTYTKSTVLVSQTAEPLLVTVQLVEKA